MHKHISASLGWEWRQELSKRGHKKTFKRTELCITSTMAVFQSCNCVKVIKMHTSDM